MNQLGSLLIVVALAACGDKQSSGSTIPEPVSTGDAPAVAAPAGAAPAVTRPTSCELDGHSLVLPSPIAFADGTADLAAGAEAGLVTIQAYLEDKSYITAMRIEGHVASAGDLDGGQALTAQRALAVTRWLVAHGVDCKRLVPAGFAGTKPKLGDARDTRIEAINAALRDRPMGGMPLEGGGRVAGDPCS